MTNNHRLALLWLKIYARAACEKATKQKLTHPALFDALKDCQSITCASARYFTDESGKDGYQVIITGSHPHNETLRRWLSQTLSERFPDSVEVVL